MKNALRRGKGDLKRGKVIEKRVHNKTSLALQNFVDTGHDAVGSFGLSLSSYRGV